VPRGEVGLVFAAIGSATWSLSKPLEVSIIIMVILTTFFSAAAITHCVWNFHQESNITVDS
jgi:hypothetical protein